MEFSNSQINPKKNSISTPPTPLTKSLLDLNSHEPDFPNSNDTSKRVKFFTELADKIVSCISPTTVLDFGCTDLLLVENLRALGVEAVGLAFSEKTEVGISPGLQPFWQKGDLLEPLTLPYDLIVCLDVFEQLSPEEADRVVQNLALASDDILFSSNPTGYIDPTHKNSQEPPYWAALFARHGFQHDLDFDASFISGWAMRFRKTDLALANVVLDYEQQLWKANHQLEALRGLLVNGSTLKNWQILQSLQIKLQIADQNGQKMESELQELRQALTQSEHEILQQKNHAERTLQLFKIAQTRFRQMERERDLQILTVERNRTEAEQQLAYLQDQLEAAKQDISQYQGRVYQLENELRDVQTNRVGRAAHRVKGLVRKSFYLAKSTLHGQIEYRLDLPARESISDGTLHLAGWAYSNSAPINDVVALLDDKFLGQVKYGLPRPDVIKKRPWQPALNCGFEAKLKVDDNFFPAGTYTLKVAIRDLKGNRQEIAFPVNLI